MSEVIQPWSFTDLVTTMEPVTMPEEEPRDPNLPPLTPEEQAEADALRACGGRQLHIPATPYRMNLWDYLVLRKHLYALGSASQEKLQGVQQEKVMTVEMWQALRDAQEAADAGSFAGIEPVIEYLYDEQQLTVVVSPRPCLGDYDPMPGQNVGEVEFQVADHLMPPSSSSEPGEPNEPGLGCGEEKTYAECVALEPPTSGGAAMKKVRTVLSSGINFDGNAPDHLNPQWYQQVANYKLNMCTGEVTDLTITGDSYVLAYTQVEYLQPGIPTEVCWLFWCMILCRNEIEEADAAAGQANALGAAFHVKAVLKHYIADGGDPGEGFEDLPVPADPSCARPVIAAGAAFNLPSYCTVAAPPAANAE